MGRRSSIDRLPRVAREAVDAALKRGCTLDEVVEAVRGAGGAVSRSAVHRYAQKAEEVAERMREAKTIAQQLAPSVEAMANEKTGRLILQMFETLVFRFLVNQGQGEAIELTPKNLMEIGRALKDAQQAASFDVAREMKLRQSIAAEIKDRIGEEVVKTGAADGWSAEQVNKYRALVLGVEL